MLHEVGQIRRICECISDANAVLSTPLLHDAHNILDLRVVVCLENAEHLLKLHSSSLSSNSALEYTNTSAAFTFPVFRIRIKSLENVEGFSSVEKFAHFVAVMSYQL